MVINRILVKTLTRNLARFLLFVDFEISLLLSLYIFERNFSGSDFKASVSSSLAESTLFNDHDGKTPAWVISDFDSFETISFAKGIFRAIEQNSYLVRSANKGISAIINNKGEVIKKLNIHESGNIDLEVPLIRSKNKNKNDLIFFILLFTYILIFKYYEKINVKK